MLIESLSLQMVSSKKLGTYNCCNFFAFHLTKPHLLVCFYGDRSHDYLMSINDGRYKRLVEYNEIGGDMKKSHILKKDKDDDDEEDKSVAVSDIEEEELEKKAVKELSNRARVMARSDSGLFFIGGIGSILAGIVYPAWGVVFAFMIELLYHPVFSCDDSSGSFILDSNTYNSCQDYWDNEADYLRQFSFKVSYAWAGIVASSIIGNILLFYGFGAATERMNKRIRDSIFIALMRQDVAYYDTHSVSNLSTKLEDDAAMMHSFSGEPIRQLTMMLSSLAVGLILSFYFMW